MFKQNGKNLIALSTLYTIESNSRRCCCYRCCMRLCVFVYLTAFSIQLHISTNSNNKIIAIVACIRDATPAVHTIFTLNIAHFIHARVTKIRPSTHIAQCTQDTLAYIQMNAKRLFIIQCLPRAPHDTYHTYVRDAYSPNLSIKCTYSSYQFGLTPLVFLSFLHHHHHHHHRLCRRRRRCRLHVGEENIENCMCERASEGRNIFGCPIRVCQISPQLMSHTIFKTDSPSDSNAIVLSSPPSSSPLPSSSSNYCMCVCVCTNEPYTN